MELRDQILMLGRMQEQDSRIDKVLDEQRRIPVEIGKINAKIDEAKGRYEEVKAALEEWGRKRKDMERDLQAGEDRLKKEKTKLMGVKTNEEYQAVNKEIAHQESANSTLSDEILLLMERIEQAELEVKKARLVFETTQKSLNGEIAKFEARLGELPAQLDELLAVRAQYTPGLDANLLRKYDALRTQKNGVAIAKANGGICGGCHMAVSPLVVNRLQTSREMIQCSNCKRILYWEGEARVNNPGGNSEVTGDRT